MRRKAFLTIAAAAAVAAIVVLTTGAFGGTAGRSTDRPAATAATAGRSDQPGDGGLGSCLASHGVQVPSNDPVAVKRWLSDRQNDPAVQAALQACAGPQEAGPTPAELVACLEQHGVDVPSDVKENPDALKPWLVEAMQQPSVKAAVEAC
jgi:hypothetical protein